MRIEERRYTETARDYALRILKNNIVSMELKPGVMVSENELSAQMGLSRTPVREALMDLAKCRAVDVLPQRGSRIALIDYALVEEARFARQVLEVAILDLVCEQATPTDIAQLRQNVRMQMLMQEPGMGETQNMLELDDAFHQMLFRIAQKENTYSMLCSMTIHFDRVRSLALDVIRDSSAIEDHRAICEAIAVHDAQKAKEVMTRHLSRVRVDEEAVRRAYPQYMKEQVRNG
ncbi:MAG: GntR family transcriptional regulator [Christensenellales bacterium]|nr:GntR family transcriptional regulator [Christensenellales bacterium]